jgi:hypothetical protein
MNKLLLAAFTAAALSGCAGDQLVVRYGGPVVPAQPVMSADGPVTAGGGPVMWDGRGVFSGP